MPTGNPKLLVKTPTSKNFSLGHAEYLEVFSGVKIGVDFTKVIHSFSCLFYPLCTVIDTGHKKREQLQHGLQGTFSSYIFLARKFSWTLLVQNQWIFFLSLVYLHFESMYNLHIHSKSVTLEACKKPDSENNLWTAWNNNHINQHTMSYFLVKN